MWVLNNEGEAMIQWRSQPKQPYRDQYDGFYIDIIIPIMRDAEIQISQNFMDTSPSNGVDSFDPYIKNYNLSDAGSPYYGDGHFYYLTLDCEDPDTFPAFRFLSESGF